MNVHKSEISRGNKKKTKIFHGEKYVIAINVPFKFLSFCKNAPNKSNMFF